MQATINIPHGPSDMEKLGVRRWQSSWVTAFSWRVTASVYGPVNRFLVIYSSHSNWCEDVLQAWRRPLLSSEGVAGVEDLDMMVEGGHFRVTNIGLLLMEAVHKPTHLIMATTSDGKEGVIVEVFEEGDIRVVLLQDSIMCLCDWTIRSSNLRRKR